VAGACLTIGFEIGVETNGPILPPERLYWICVSPKAAAELVLRRGQELKLVYRKSRPCRMSSKASPSSASRCS
jgi:hypothetical protein